jgi:23S rRNA pseudoU1915 N3-methylase RlmH
MLKLLLNLAFCACLAWGEKTDPIPKNHAGNNPNQTPQTQTDIPQTFKFGTNDIKFNDNDYKAKVPTFAQEISNFKDYVKYMKPEDVVAKTEELQKKYNLNPFLKDIIGIPSDEKKTDVKEVSSKLEQFSAAVGNTYGKYSPAYTKDQIDKYEADTKKAIEAREKELAEEEKKRQEKQQEEIDNFKRDAENRMNNQAENYKKALNNKRDNLSDSLAKALQNAQNGGNGGGNGGSSMENSHISVGQGLSSMLDKLANKFIQRPGYTSNNNNNENSDKKTDTAEKLQALNKSAEEDADDIKEKTKPENLKENNASADKEIKLQDGEEQQDIPYQASGGGGASANNASSKGGGGGNNFGQGEKVVGKGSSPNADSGDGVAWNSIGKLEPPPEGPTIKRGQKYLLLKPGAEMGEGSQGATGEGGEANAEGGDDLFGDRRKNPSLASQLLPVNISEDGVKGLMGYVGRVIPQACITERSQNIKRRIARVCFHKNIQPRMIAIVEKREKEK